MIPVRNSDLIKIYCQSGGLGSIKRCAGRTRQPPGRRHPTVSWKLTQHPDCGHPYCSRMHQGNCQVFFSLKGNHELGGSRLVPLLNKMSSSFPLDPRQVASILGMKTAVQLQTFHFSPCRSKRNREEHRVCIGGVCFREKQFFQGTSLPQLHP